LLRARWSALAPNMRSSAARLPGEVVRGVLSTSLSPLTLVISLGSKYTRIVQKLGFPAKFSEVGFDCGMF
jgi:hypothetical protein